MTVVARAAPRPLRRTAPVARALTVAAWLILLAALGNLVAQAWPHPPYTVDSWGYYELSRHLGTHFFRINTWRSYQSDIPYGVSFGPMWPITIKIVGLLTHASVRAGLIAAIACVIATAGALTAFARRTGLHPAVGPVAVAGLLAFRPYADEVMSARSIPLALLLLSVLLWLLPGATGPRAGAAGVVAALAVLTRTDLLVAMVLLAGVLLVRRRLPWLAAGGFAAAMLPWAGYSLFHFGTLLASDNTLVSEAVPQIHSGMVLDPAAVPTVADHPGAWLSRVALNAGPVAIGWGRSISTVPLLVALLGGLAAWAWRRPPALRLPLLLLGCVLVQTAVGQMTTGYRDSRYLGTALLFALVVAVGSLLECAQGLRRIAAGWAAVGLAVLLAGGSAAYPAPTGAPDVLTGGAAEVSARRCHDPAATLLTAPMFGARHGALTGLPVALPPVNFRFLSAAEVRAWLERYGVLQMYEPPDARYLNMFAYVRQRISEVATLVPDPCATVGRLYRIELN